jgi:hypothetical protein
MSKIECKGDNSNQPEEKKSLGLDLALLALVVQDFQ